MLGVWLDLETIHGAVYVRPRRLNHPSEGTRIRTLANHRSVEILLSSEASDATEEQDLTRADILTALRNCSVIESIGRGAQWRRVVRGTDIDGCLIVMTITVVYQV